MNNRELAVKLATLEDEDEVVRLLKTQKLWDNTSCWRPFGDNDNNFSTIGNQQSKADAALVEKLINSVDAILMKECMIRGIDMESAWAPHSISEAMKEFFNISEGQIANLDMHTRSKMAESIILAATGKAGYLNLTIADRGEGQTPNRMSQTLLSLSRDNKLKIPFVQGKFNMGGTGVLPFCGKHHLQLLISKRCPDLDPKGDPSFGDWSVTLVRRESPREGRKSSMFTYLTDERGEVLRFKANALLIIPRPQNEPHEAMEYGTYIKLYNYEIQKYKTNIMLAFNFRMSMLMPQLAHPVRLRECRNYTSNYYEATLAGLLTRLSIDSEGNLEPGFPSSETFTIDGQPLRCSIYVFKKDKSVTYREKEGILYTVNGQTHAAVNESFFNKANLSYLANSLLLLVDCSEVSIQHREDMFMNSRDRLRRGPFVEKIEKQLQEILGSHAGLRRLQHDRRQAQIQEKIKDDKPMQEVLENILTKSPVLSKVFLKGQELSNPFVLETLKGTGDHFKGVKHPTFFTLVNKKSGKERKIKIPANQASCQVQFETDAENEYFSRPSEPGRFLVSLNGQPRQDLIKHLSLFQGTATLRLTIPDHVKADDLLLVETSLEDDCIYQDFRNAFYILITEAVDDQGSGGKGQRKPPAGTGGDKKRQAPNQLALPKIYEVNQVNWTDHDMDRDSALVIKKTDEGSDYYLNMDNRYLLTELKVIRDKEKMELTKARYKYSMTLIGMSAESHCLGLSDEDEEEKDVTKCAREITSIIAPVLIPMIESMAALDEGAIMAQDDV